MNFKKIIRKFDTGPEPLNKYFTKIDLKIGLILKWSKKLFSEYYLAYTILIWILFLLFAAFYPYSFNVENSRYLLSAISQGMAAIFAIIFTILLVFT